MRGADVAKKKHGRNVHVGGGSRSGNRWRWIFGKSNAHHYFVAVSRTSLCFSLYFAFWPPRHVSVPRSRECKLFRSKGHRGKNLTQLVFGISLFPGGLNRNLSVKFAEHTWILPAVSHPTLRLSFYYHYLLPFESMPNRGTLKGPADDQETAFWPWGPQSVHLCRWILIHRRRGSDGSHGAAPRRTSAWRGSGQPGSTRRPSWTAAGGTERSGKQNMGME